MVRGKVSGRSYFNAIWPFPKFIKNVYNFDIFYWNPKCKMLMKINFFLLRGFLILKGVSKYMLKFWPFFGPFDPLFSHVILLDHGGQVIFLNWQKMGSISVLGKSAHMKFLLYVKNMILQFLQSFHI